MRVNLDRGGSEEKVRGQEVHMAQEMVLVDGSSMWDGGVSIVMEHMQK